MYIGKISKEGIELVVEVPKEHQDILLDSIKKLEFFDDSLNSYLSLQLSIEDYQSFLTIYHEKIKEDPIFTEFNISRFYALARFRTQNIIINFGLYLEHTKYILRKKIGKQSAGYNKFIQKKELLE